MASQGETPSEEPTSTHDDFVNIYNATADAYVTDIRLDDEAISASPFHKIKPYSKAPKVVLDPYAPDYKEVFLDKGSAMAPDEILHALRPSALKIPLKPREDFDDANALPDSDLLRAINYYASAAKVGPHSMDETALLALGMLVEQWAEEEVAVHDPSLFLEPDGSLDVSKYGPIVSDEEGSEEGETTHDSDSASADSARWSGEESDIMSIELSESDTASEVEGGRIIKRKKLGPGKGVDSESRSANSKGEDSSDDSSDSSDSDSSSGSSSSMSGSDTSNGSRDAESRQSKVANGGTDSYMDIAVSSVAGNESEKEKSIDSDGGRSERSGQGDIEASASSESSDSDSSENENIDDELRKIGGTVSPG